MFKNRIIVLVEGELTPFRIVHLQKILMLIKDFFSQIVVIYSGRSNLLQNSTKTQAINIKSLDLNSNSPLYSKLFHLFRSDFTRVKMLLKYSNNSDYVLFLGIYQPLSLFITRLRGGYPINFCGGFDVIYSSNRVISKIFSIVKWAAQMAMLTLTKKLIFETPSVIYSFNLNKFRKKSFIDGHLFVDLTYFFPAIPIEQRHYDIGFIGAFSEEKGVINFVSSIPYIVSHRQVTIHIVGHGHLRNIIKEIISMRGLSNVVHLQGPVKHFDLPKVLNNIKILVVPSFSEGLPNIVIEAMACGTVVLASSVGGISDVLKDGQTGFLLRLNDPRHIAKRIIELLSKPELLEEVSKKAHEYVGENFSYDKALEAWQKILNQLE
ncbi:MAG: glycosyltransferase family 4 protein [Candidatus Methanomethyliaceae archaeon]